MGDFRVMAREWKADLGRLIGEARTELVVSSPYGTREGTEFVNNNLSSSFRAGGKLKFLTDLSPLNICQRATQPSALRSFATTVPAFLIWHLPKLHAKVYIADRIRAIVTSGNLTAGGLSLNYECGVRISDREIIDQLLDTINDYAFLGVQINDAQLIIYSQIAERVVRTYESQFRSTAQAARLEFDRSFRDAEDELIRLRLAGGAITSVFEKTVLYLLRRRGPLRTTQLHPLIQGIHPDLCDDTVDRVIDGQHFGKKWKHAVRRAQSHLKDRGEAELRNGVWRLTQG